MKLSGIIKHSRSMDAAFSIFHCLDVGKKVILKGQWINQGFVASYPIMLAKIEIQKVDVKNWLACNTPQEKCLRNSTWRSL